MKNTTRSIIGRGLLLAGLLSLASLPCALAEGTASCTPGTSGCGWKEGDITTYGEVGWSVDPGYVLRTNFDSIYARQGGVEVGIPGKGGYSIRFSSAAHVIDYLPAIGPLRPLDADVVDPPSSLINPTSTSSGAFGGIVLALRLNIDLSDAGVLRSNTGLRFGDLRLCNYTRLTSLNGMTVRNLSALANTLLGGGSNGYTIDDITEVAGQLGEAFLNGVPNPFAQDHIVNGPCP
jgi:hypothetical protein